MALCINQKELNPLYKKPRKLLSIKPNKLLEWGRNGRKEVEKNIQLKNN